MTDRTVFPTIKSVLVSGSNVQSFTVGATAVKAGQVVAHSATGLDMTVVPAIAESGECPIGVALTSVGVAGKVAVACAGCFAYVTNYDDTATVDAGHWVMTNDAALAGGVEEAALTATGGATATIQPYVIGRLVTDMAASGNAILYVLPCVITRANTS